MPGINEDRERQVVPLWRSFDATISRGELGPLTPMSDEKFTDAMVSELLEDWREQNSLSFASDLVSIALTLGRFAVAEDAARFILSDAGATTAARDIAELYLAKGRVQVGNKESISAIQADLSAASRDPGNIKEQLHSGVRAVRKQLIAHPRNPVNWMNLARLYTSLGIQNKAMRAMQVALAMAPQNRFVLRAASRLLLHLGKSHEAHRLLFEAPNLKADPWVLAAEIATAAAKGKTSRNIKFARRVLELQRQTPFHLSELASALGTLESLSGNLKKGRQLINLSLEQPAENSIAQAAWLGRKVGVALMRGPEATTSFEANAWFAWSDSNWEKALHAALLWQADQPFSSRPAILGSHLASTALQDYDLAVAFADQGLLSNPDDFSLQNNLVFASALRGDVQKAQSELRKINVKQLTDPERVVFSATTGLVAFRSGNFDLGRSCYQSAMALGKRLRDEREAIARIYYAFEEVRIGSANAEAIRKEALDGAKMLNQPPYIALMERLRRYRAP